MLAGGRSQLSFTTRIMAFHFQLLSRDSNPRSADLTSSSRDVSLAQKQDRCSRPGLSRLGFSLPSQASWWHGGTGAQVCHWNHDAKSCAPCGAVSLEEQQLQRTEYPSSRVHKRCLMPSVLLSEDVLTLVLISQVPRQDRMEIRLRVSKSKPVFRPDCSAVRLSRCPYPPATVFCPSGNLPSCDGRNSRDNRRAHSISKVMCRYGRIRCGGAVASGSKVVRVFV